VLIVNTNGGGHSPIGFWLSKQLADKGHKVSEAANGAAVA
jgi:hypothetical protein